MTRVPWGSQGVYAIPFPSRFTLLWQEESFAWTDFLFLMFPIKRGNNDNNRIIFGHYVFLVAFHQMLSGTSQSITDLASLGLLYFVSCR